MTNSGIYFNGEALPEARHYYVSWLDVMGSTSVMSISMRRAANNVMKLHVAILEECHEDVRCFPAVDGLYLASETPWPLLTTLSAVMRRMSNEFLQKANEHRVVPRAGIAFGPVIFGDQTASASEVLGATENANYVESILFGAALSQAFRAESQAPPFGVYVDETARVFFPQNGSPVPGPLWSWWKPAAPGEGLSLKSALMEYLDWCEANSTGIIYSPEAIRRHRSLATEYFPTG